MKQLFSIFFCLIIFYSLDLKSQEPVHYHLTEKDNLPDIEFYQMIEDKQGFIWLAANKGLFRYDGEKFLNFNHPKKRALSVFNLQLDNDGNIWCNNISGQFFFVKNQKLNLFIDLETETNGQLSDFIIDKKNIIANTNKGIYSINLINKEKKRVLKKFKNGLRSFYKKKDTLFFIKDYKLGYTTDYKNTFIKVDISKYKHLNFTHFNIFPYKENLLILLKNTEDKNIKKKGLFIKNKKIIETDFFKHGLQTDFINVKEIDNKLWALTNSGIKIYNRKEKFILENSYLKKNTISDVLKDSNNNFWVSTLENGIFIIPNLHVTKYKELVHNETINALEKIDSKNILYGSNKGKIGVFNLKNQNNKLLKTYKNKKIISTSQNKKDIFLALKEISLIYNKEKNSFNEVNYFKHAKDIFTIGEDKIVSSLSASARILDLKNNQHKALRFKRAYTNYYNKEKKEIYVGYIDGLKKYDDNLKETDIFFNKKPIFAIDIEETENGIIWVSTFKDGIIGIKKNNQLISFTTKNGLISNQTNKIKADKNLLWISSDKGLQVLNTINNNFKTLTNKDGITSFIIFDILAFENEIILSSNDGLFKIDKKKAFKKHFIRDFYFTKILINDKKAEIKEEYNLSYNYNKLQFNFNTNGFLSEENLTYLYKLETESNSKQKWSLVNKKSKEVTFNNLAPGNYIFKIKSRIFNDKVETTEKEIKIFIQNPFYKKVWFLTIITLLILSLLLIFFYYKINQFRKKQKAALEKEKILRQLATTKLESLQSQMNPHFTFNALNSIQNLILKGNKEKAYNYLTKFSNLIRENLQLSQQNFIHFHKEIEVTTKYLELEKLRFRDNFSFTISYDKSIESIEIPTMIIQPFIENAINHGLLHKIDGKRKLELIFTKKDTLECIIIDNGIGIIASKKINQQNSRKQSFSTKSIEEKLNFLKEYYKMDIGFYYPKVKKGTKLILNIPYRENG